MTKTTTNEIAFLSGLFWSGVAVEAVNFTLYWGAFADNPPLQRALSPMATVGGLMMMIGMLARWAVRRARAAEVDHAKEMA